MTPVRSVRLAAALWIVLAVVVWNVVFDRVLVLAGRSYVFAAATASAASRPYVLADGWMSAAKIRAFWLATGAGGAVLVTGLLLVLAAARRQARLPTQPG